MPSTKTYAVAAAVLVAAGLGAGAWFVAGRDAGDPCGGGVATGGATIGGPFELVSETGETVTDKDVIDRPALVYFGYTFCPDVCPVDAAIMAQAADALKEQGHDVKTVFVTVDPARDTPKVLADFTDNLDPDMIGLSGSAEQIDAAAKAYKVYYGKAEGDDPEYYLMDHSAFTYLMAPEGFLAVFRHGDAADAIVERAACYLENRDASGDGA